jgi:hypothetical protein
MKTLFRAFADESRLVFCDWGVLIITVLAVVVYAFIYSVPYVNQVLKNVPVAVIDEDHSGLSRRFVRMVDEHESIRVAAEPRSMAEAEALVRNGSVVGVLVIPRSFERQILEGRQARVSSHIAASYLLATLFLGFTLRAFFSHRETAMQVLLFTSILFVFLGGFARPFEGVPAWIRQAAQVVPTTAAIPAYLRLTRFGAGLADVSQETAALWALTAIYFPTACVAEYLRQRKARRLTPAA